MKHLGEKSLEGLFFFRYHLQEKFFHSPAWSNKTLHPGTLCKCSVRFYLYKYLNFVYSSGFTSLLSSSWHRLNLIWARVSLSLTPPLSALTAQEQKGAFVKSYGISSCLIFDSLQPTFLPFSFLVPQLLPLYKGFSR